MNGQTELDEKSLNTKAYLRNKVSEYVEQCIQCHRCMDICPVTKGSFSIDELNQASLDGQEVPSKIKKFVFHCTQCGRCVPVCPVNIRRDHMVRYLKFTLRNQKPWRYTRYLFIKGPDLTGFKGIAQRLYIAGKKMANRNLASFMETTPQQRADVLFYPGCYLYSTHTVRQTLRLLNHLGCSFTVLGGVTACCGAPHMLQGEFEQADHSLKLLYKKIKACNPQIILTACAECFEVLEQIKKFYHEEFEVLSVTQYLVRHQDKFPKMKIRGKVLIHDSCRFRRESPQGIAGHDAVSIFGERVEPLTDQSSCCYQWNHGNDPGNTLRRTSYLETVKHHAPTLACNCITCYEELKKISASVEIIDIIDLFDEALNNVQSTEHNQ